MKYHHYRCDVFGEGATMNPLMTLFLRRIVKITSASVMLTILVVSVTADDVNPGRILGGKPAISGGGSSRYYDGGGRYMGRSAGSGSTTRMYNGGKRRRLRR
jgi:hypothetical protein